jgi:membrane-bound ClpP family serine protease
MNEEKRFKHKLNMLEPGTKMLKWIGILILIGILLFVFQLRKAAFCIWAIAGIVFVILLILLAIEAYQDNVLNESAIEENKKNGVL